MLTRNFEWPVFIDRHKHHGCFKSIYVCYSVILHILLFLKTVLLVLEFNLKFIPEQQFKVSKILHVKPINNPKSYFLRIF